MEFNCSYYKKNICRSCDLLELDYEKQIETKNNKLKSLYCDLYENFEIQDFISIKQPFESRYKAKFSVSGSTLNPKIGLITNDYKGIELLNCPLHYPGLNVTIKEIKKQIIKHNIKPYNIADKTGELKNIIIQSSKFNGTQIIRFILNSKKYLKTLKIVSDKITKKFKKIKVVSVNIQPIHQAILEGEEEIIITKKQCITEVFENFKILYYPGSFMQVSPEIAEKLYSTVKDVVLKIEPKIIWDLYCGAGPFSFFMAEHCETLYAFEISEKAIDGAKNGLRINKINNINFNQMDILDSFNLSQVEQAQLILLNPPRRGLGPEVCDKINKISPEHIIYSSCNPESQLEDCKNFKKAGYTLNFIQGFDMFPLTSHFECLIHLSK